MLASLESLASDCLLHLAQFLSGDDLVSLLSTGNRLLRQKLMKVGEVEFEASLPGSIFPLAAFNLPKLQSLSVFGINERFTYLDFSKGRELALVRGSKTLKVLDLRFRNAPALFWSPDASLPRSLIRDRFPSLTTLILRRITCEESLEELCGELPSFLTTLEFFFFNLDIGASFNLSWISKLPRNMTSLKLTNCNIYEPVDSGEEYASILPPNLRVLELNQMSQPMILDYLPSTLENLSFGIRNPPEGYEWRTSKLPPALVHLDFVPEGWTLIYDAPLPSTLEEFPFADRLLRQQDLPNAISALPRGFRKLHGRPILRSHFAASDDPVAALNALFSTFSNIRSTDIWHEANIPFLPRRLETLFCGEIGLSSPLPNSLTHLLLQATPSYEEISNIPPTLKSLEFGVSGLDSLFSVANPLHREFPPWGSAELSQLASLTSLTSLSIEMRYLDSVECLSPIAKMESLEKLKLHRLSLHEFQSMPHWLPRCLPRNLRKLKLITPDTSGSLDELEEIGNPVPYDFLRLCHLDKVCPNLNKLSIWFFVWEPLSLGESLATLPSQLRSLIFKFRLLDIEPSALSLLPRSLTSLKLDFEDHIDIPLTNKHFEGLPEKLALLHVYAPSSSMSADVLPILPNTIAELALEDLEANDDYLSRQASAFLASNPLFLGFRCILFQD